ncbi:MAG: M67 family metallopeptidase [Gemmatales bacterium]
MSNDVNACAAYLMVMTLHIPEAIYQQLVGHARSELPNECVGMLIGSSDGQVNEYLPLVNELKSPTRFLTEPRSMLRAEKRCRELKLQVLAIFHSHPTSQAIPSKYDVADHYSSDVMCLILSLTDISTPLRGWWIGEGSFKEGEIMITPATKWQDILDE